MAPARCCSILLLLVAPLLLSAGCGPMINSSCDEGCDRINACTGGASAGTPANFGFYCPTDGCGAQVSCEALCIVNAPCAVVTGADGPGVDRLRACVAACRAQGKPDNPAPPTPRPQGGDAGVPPAPTPDTRPPPPPSCSPNCKGRVCGADGCGGSCGSCKSYLACHMPTGSCKPKTSASCWPLNECQYVGQKTCTGSLTYRECVKGYDGCLTWDCET